MKQNRSPIVRRASSKAHEQNADKSEGPPAAPPRKDERKSSDIRSGKHLVSVEKVGDGWNVCLESGGVRHTVFRSNEAFRDLAHELQITLNMSSEDSFALQLRGLIGLTPCSGFFEEGVSSKSKDKWYVDVQFVEGRNLVVSGGDTFYLSACLESSPKVRFVSVDLASTDHVWNADASFVSDDAESDRLHVSLNSKKSKSVWGKFTLRLKPLVGLSGPQHMWFNLRDVYDAVCIAEDVQVDPDQALPFGYLSAGLVHLQVEVSNNPSNMFLSRHGMPLRSLPFRVQPGDLVFFSSKKLATTGTKIATRSRWDHVAIVVPFKSYRKMYMLQSTSHGVQVSEAEATLQSYWNSTKAFGIRRLLRPSNDDSFCAALAEFAERNVGKAYNYNVIQVLQRKRTSSKPHLSSSSSGSSGTLTTSASAGSLEELDKSDKMFCSQLVAAAYIYSGVLPKDDVASSYLPSTFAKTNVHTNSGLQLLPLVRFPRTNDSSQDLVWAREESYVRESFRVFVTGLAFQPATRESARMLKKIRKRLLLITMFARSSSDRRELSFEEGDTILLLEKDPSGWWTGQHQGNGRVGLFPANHCVVAKSLPKNKRKPIKAATLSSDAKSPSSVSSPAVVRIAEPEENASIECSVCHKDISSDVPTVVLNTATLHERCLSIYITQRAADRESRCFVCGIVSHLSLSPCAKCSRNVCPQCCSGPDVSPLCKVCTWIPTDREAKALDVLIAVDRHVNRSPHEMQFAKGDDIELLERLDWGWNVGRTDKSFGLFPEESAVAVVKKFSLRRLKANSIKKAGSGRKSPLGGSSSSMSKLKSLVKSSDDDLSMVKPAETPRGPTPQVPPLNDVRLSAYSSLISASEDNDSESILTRSLIQASLSDDSGEDSVESVSFDSDEPPEQDDEQEDQEEESSSNA